MRDVPELPSLGLFFRRSIVGLLLLALVICIAYGATGDDAGKKRQGLSERMQRGRDVRLLSMAGSEGLAMGKIEALIREGADINARDPKDGLNILMKAVWAHRDRPMDPVALSRLVDLGLDLEARDDSGRTALMFSFAHPELFEFLLGRGADVNAAAYAWHEGNESYLDKIREPIRNPFIKVGDPIVQSRRIAISSDVSVRSLTVASVDFYGKRGGESVLALLCNRIAASGGERKGDVSIDLLARLIERGAKLDLRDALDRTPLMALADMAQHHRHGKNRIPIVANMLIEAGADLEAIGPGGRTPLLCAAAAYTRGQSVGSGLLCVLAESGADVHKRDENGDTALTLLAAKGLAYWKPAGDGGPTGGGGIEEVARAMALLLDAGAEVDAANGVGETALMIVAKRGAPLPLVELLMERGADPNLRSGDGNSAVMHAFSAPGEDRGHSYGIKNAVLDVDGLHRLLDGVRERGTLCSGNGTALLETAYPGRTWCARSGDVLEIFEPSPLPDDLARRVVSFGWTRAEMNKALLASLDSTRMSMFLVGLLVQSGADINARDADGRNMLMRAMAPELYRVPTTEEISKLLSLGCDANAKGPGGGNLLTMPASGGLSVEALSLLVYGGADVLDVGENGTTCMHIERPGDCVALLLDAGANPRAVDGAGRTPLHTAHPRDASALSLLLERGVDVNACDDAGRTALISWMERGGGEEGIRALLDAGADVSIADTTGRVPLLFAVQQRGGDGDPSYWRWGQYAGYIRVFLEHGADPNHIFADGGTPLSLLVQQRTALGYRFNSTDVFEPLERGIRALLEYGAEPYMRDARQTTAWQYAKRNGDARVFQMLKEASENRPCPYAPGQTRLMTAAGDTVDKETLERLLGDGESLAATDSLGWTALTHAAWSNPDPACVDFLVSRGAKVDHRDKFGKTPLMRAVWNNSNADVALALIRSGAQVGLRDATGGHAIEMAIARDAPAEVISVLFDAASEVTGPERLGGEMLLSACMVTERPETLKTLLERGVSVDYRDGSRQTALMKTLSRNPRPELVRVLIAAGANVNARDAQGISVLDYALMGNVEAHKLLLDAGADPKEESVWWPREDKDIILGFPEQRLWNTRPRYY